MADRMIVMNAGRAEQIGTPLEVYERPQTLFAAQFIGSPSMNVLDGEVTTDGLTIGDVKVPTHMKTSGKVTVGIRPEHIIADPDGSVINHRSNGRTTWREYAVAWADYRETMTPSRSALPAFIMP